MVGSGVGYSVFSDFYRGFDPANAPRKIENGNSESTNAKATALAMEKPLSA